MRQMMDIVAHIAYRFSYITEWAALSYQDKWLIAWQLPNSEGQGGFLMFFFLQEAKKEQNQGSLKVFWL